METEKNLSALLVYLSPHGTTRKAIEALSLALTESGILTDVCSLGEFKDKSALENLNARMSSYSLIVFGSPTYFHHAPPVFTDFINQIPNAAGDQAAAILSTFGGVSSGVIQFDLAKLLHKKKYSLIGGIQVLAEHCLTFQEKSSFYGGHPDEKDLAVIREFGKEIAGRLMNQNRQGYPPAAFKDKPFILNFIDAHFNSLKTFAWSMPGVKVKKIECTGCGLCVKSCPTTNITLDQVAVHGKNCTYCYSCVRHCPAGATTASLKPIAPMVKWLAGAFAKFEEQVTRQVV